MDTSRKILIAVGAIALLGTAAALAIARSDESGLPVQFETVERRDLVSTVRASGNIRARRTVDISSDVSARVAELAVREGEDVVAGQVLLRLDPRQFEAARARAAAALSQAQAQAATQEANLLRAERAHDRVLRLQQRDSILVSSQQIEDAQTELDVARANLESARYSVDQADASLEEAEDRLARTVFRAPISGKVTRLNVEEGETVVVGTMNNPGSLVLTISDLSTVEAVVQVDETDVPELALGDSAVITIDAFPRAVFTGRVTEIGNSAIRPPTGQAPGQPATIDFEVVITLDEPPVLLRPDLSATADIVTDVREDAVSIPIIALTVREQDADSAEDAGEDGSPTTGPEPDPEAGASGGARDDFSDVEGVFRVRDGTAEFVPVEVGIAGAEHFEIVSGVEVGDTVVAGPYQSIRQLQSGDPVRRADDPPGGATAGSG